MSASFLAKAEKAIPAEVHMFSGCEDSQTSADVSNVSAFELPDPAGKAGGALTTSLLKVLYADHKKPDEDLTYQEVLMKVRDVLKDAKFTQTPQLSSSRPLNIHQPFRVVPEGNTGERRAVLIGINYVGQQGELSGCQNDVLNVKEYLMDVHGFKESNITLLLDDGKHTNPTMANILHAYKTLVSQNQPGDCCYCHFAGHGGQLPDDDGDEEDGYDETLIPVDYKKTGQIRDDDLFTTLVVPMRKGVHVTCVFDCCHSGTVLDLPYMFTADGKATEMTAKDNFNFGHLFSFGTYKTFVKNMVDKGKKSDNRDADSGYKFGDFTRGLASALGSGK